MSDHVNPQKLRDITACSEFWKYGTCQYGCGCYHYHISQNDVCETWKLGRNCSDSKCEKYHPNNFCRHNKLHTDIDGNVIDGDCDFLHSLIENEENQQCHFFGSPGGCRKGSECNFLHQQPSDNSNQGKTRANKRAHVVQKPKSTQENVQLPNYVIGKTSQASMTNSLANSNKKMGKKEKGTSIDVKVLNRAENPQKSSDNKELQKRLIALQKELLILQEERHAEKETILEIKRQNLELQERLLEVEKKVVDNENQIKVNTCRIGILKKGLDKINNGLSYFAK